MRPVLYRLLLTSEGRASGWKPSKITRNPSRSSWAISSRVGHRPAKDRQAVQLLAHHTAGSIRCSQWKEMKSGLVRTLDSRPAITRGLPPGQRPPEAARNPGGELPPGIHLDVEAQPADYAGMEGFDASLPGLVQGVHCRLHQLADVVVIRLQFHQKGRPSPGTWAAPPPAGDGLRSPPSGMS